LSPQRSIFRITLVGLLCLALAMGVGRFAFTPLLPMMRQDGLLSIGDGGLLASIHFLGYWLGAVFAASIACPPRMMLRVSLLAIAVGTAGMGMTDDFRIWLVLRWLGGVFSAWTLVLVSSYYLRQLADSFRPECQGWVFSGVGAGILMVGLACLLFMAERIDSSQSWLILGAVTLVASCALLFNMGSEIPAARPATRNRASQRSPLDWSAVIAYGAMGIGYIIPATYLPVMAREIVPSALIFGWSWPAFGAAAFVSTLIAEKFRQRYSNRQLWAVSQVIMAIGLLLPVVYTHIVSIIAAGVCVGGTFMIITMVGMKEAHRVAPPRDVMRHIGVMTASFATGQIIGPLFASSVYELTKSFSVSLSITSVALMITALTLVERPANRTTIARN
jgi:predicted MFS family arabinose efflux permease